MAPATARTPWCVAMESTTPFTISSSKRAKEGQEPRQQHLSVTREKIEELGTSNNKEA